MTESWLERWREGRIGWHEEEGNASLKKHWRAEGKRVLVPMCGKTVDMLWLEERGNSVVGVELSDIAARAFFKENDLRYTVHEGPLPAYIAEDRDITILLAPDACRLLITLEYDDAIATGPPFSISGDEIRRYWPDLQEIERYDDIDNGPPKFRDAGLQEMFESVWR